jgi:shikimate dehydrogenase
MHESYIAGVLGYPVEHSISPEIFHFLSKRLKVSVAYRKMNIAPVRLNQSVGVLKDLNLCTGWNVTIPHKEKMAQLMDELTPESRAMGAVNVVQAKNGMLKGFNTDVFGIVETLREQKAKVRNQSAVVFGAGGAAAAVSYALGQLGAEKVYILNRTSKRSRQLANRLGPVFPKTRYLPAPMSFKLIEKEYPSISLYVNATPLGMKGVQGKPLLPQKLNQKALGFDLIYRPLKTPFLAEMKKRKLKTIGGLDMLVWQALATWEIWIGQIPHKKKVKRDLRRHLIKVLEREAK